jgi:cytochrome oxidase Cu insertion factor (SCO1/SenC/PrrC family)
VSRAADVQGVADAFYPKAGTYNLYRIQRSPTGLVIDDSVWKPRLLSNYTTGKITLFSFFYATCRDPLGCPAAWSAFQDVHDAIEKDPNLHNKVRLVFLSLDPKTDTPELLSFYHSKSTKEAPWYFLTTWSESFLKPILSGMGVAATKEIDENGRTTGLINHMLKVFLIDKDGWVREIYTTSFLNSDVVLNDIRTLMMESR